MAWHGMAWLFCLIFLSGERKGTLLMEWAIDCMYLNSLIASLEIYIKRIVWQLLGWKYFRNLARMDGVEWNKMG
jgi:hypothetical protein